MVSYRASGTRIEIADRNSKEPETMASYRTSPKVRGSKYDQTSDQQHGKEVQWR